MQYTQEGIVKITTMLLNMKQPVTVKNNWAKSNELAIWENLNIQMFRVTWSSRLEEYHLNFPPHFFSDFLDTT